MKHVESKYEEFEDYFYVYYLIVEEKFRNRGIGTKFMKKLIKIANTKNKEIQLVPGILLSVKNKINLKRLEKFYTRLGFVKADPLLYAEFSNDDDIWVYYPKIKLDKKF